MSHEAYTDEADRQQRDDIETDVSVGNPRLTQKRHHRRFALLYYTSDKKPSSGKEASSNLDSTFKSKTSIEDALSLDV
jgi:hypothetical protein